MQTLIQVVCTKGKSVRDAIANDQHLEENGLKLIKQRQSGRKPGWTKIKGMREDRRGSMNIEWNRSTSILICRVVNRGAGKPNLLVGDFINFLLARHNRRVRHITIWTQ